MEEAIEPAETDPLMGVTKRLVVNSTGSRSETEEIRSPIQWPGGAYDSSEEESAFGGRQNEYDERLRRSNGCCRRICAKLRYVLFDSNWPLSCLLAVAFLGFWLPKKKRSIWPLTFIPVFHLLFGLCAHMYFIVIPGQLTFHIGSKMMLTALWISGYASYVLALYYFRHQSHEWMKDLNKNQHRAINAALFTGVLLVSWVLFGDAYYQVIFDVNHIKHAVLQKCYHSVACNGVFYPLVVSIYWGMYSSVGVCCVFFSLCLTMKNDLSRGYARIAKCTGDVRNTLIIHRQVREQIAERVNSIRVWFVIHMLFYVVVLLVNIFDWWEAAREPRFPEEYMAQISGTLVVAFKFFFPFLSASYVTWHESTLVQDLNDKLDFLPGETFYSRQDLEVFLVQSKRRGYGFRLFKIQITITIAVFSLLGSAFGLVHNLKG
ncbi:uncharacterized protein LOC144634994 [Oculina patagonica]